MPKNVCELVLKPIAGCITACDPYNGHLVFQGGIPEVEEFIRTYEK